MLVSGWGLMVKGMAARPARFAPVGHGVVPAFSITNRLWWPVARGAVVPGAPPVPGVYL